MLPKNLVLAVAVLGATVGLLPAQITDTRDPNVFLGGPKQKKDKKATSRFLRGTVVDDTGKPLEGALVTLLDTKKNTRTTFITKKDGRYNFDDLSFTIDYEVSARFKNLQSEPRKLSQYDHTVSMVRILQVAEPLADGDAKKDVAAGTNK